MAQGKRGKTHGIWKWNLCGYPVIQCLHLTVSSFKSKYWGIHSLWSFLLQSTCQGTHTNFIFKFHVFSLFFPEPRQIFPVLFALKRLFIFILKSWKSRSQIVHSRAFWECIIHTTTIMVSKWFPCMLKYYSMCFPSVLAKFSNSMCFPDRESFFPFSLFFHVFPVCGYPDMYVYKDSCGHLGHI